MRGRHPDRRTADTRVPATGTPGTRLVAPDWLDDDARRIFTLHAGDLHHGNVVMPGDASLLAMFAATYALAVRCYRELLTRDDMGSQEWRRVNTAASSALDRATRIAGDFGFTPRHRQAMGTGHLQQASLLRALGVPGFETDDNGDVIDAEVVEDDA